MCNMANSVNTVTAINANTARNLESSIWRRVAARSQWQRVVARMPISLIWPALPLMDSSLIYHPRKKSERQDSACINQSLSHLVHSDMLLVMTLFF